MQAPDHRAVRVTGVASTRPMTDASRVQLAASAARAFSPARVSESYLARRLFSEILPGGLDQSAVLQPDQRRVNRPLVHRQLVAASENLFKPPRDPIPVQRAHRRQDVQHQQVQRPLQQVEFLVRHQPLLCDYQWSMARLLCELPQERIEGGRLSIGGLSSTSGPAARRTRRSRSPTVPGFGRFTLVLSSRAFAFHSSIHIVPGLLSFGREDP